MQKMPLTGESVPNRLRATATDRRMVPQKSPAGPCSPARSLCLQRPRAPDLSVITKHAVRGLRSGLLSAAALFMIMKSLMPNIITNQPDHENGQVVTSGGTGRCHEHTGTNRTSGSMTCRAGRKRARHAGGLVHSRPEFVARIWVDVILKVVRKSS